MGIYKGDRLIAGTPLPVQTGQSGKYLTTNGTNTSWATIQQAPSTDDKTISLNSDDELQTIGVINKQDNSTAIKYWVGTKAQYDALQDWYGWRREYDSATIYTKIPYGSTETIEVYDSTFTLIPLSSTEDPPAEWYENMLYYTDSNENYYGCVRNSSIDVTGKDPNTLYNVKGEGEAVTYNAYTKTETDLLLDEKADTDLSNVSGLTATITELNYTDGVTSNIQTQCDNKLNKQQITNCILEDPQNIKLELNNGTLTLKAGSVVCVPNGFESDGTTPKFDEVEIESDITRSGLTHNAQTMTVIRSSGTIINDTYPLAQFFSGTTAPTSYQYMCWYDTANNLVKTTYDTGATWNTGFALPIAILTESSTGITSIDQTFQSIGYIGSTVFVRKGLKVLIPNGRNDDGSLKNTEYTIDKVYTATRTWNTSYNQRIFLVLNASSVSNPVWYYNDYIYSSSEPSKNYTIWYNPSTNKTKLANGSTSSTVWEDCNAVSLGNVFGDGTTVISAFDINTATNILKYPDKSPISSWSMPSNKYTDLTVGSSGATYGAPANGWFAVRGAGTSSSNNWIELINTTSGALNTGVYGTVNWQFKSFIPAKEGDTISLYYSNINFVFFRFIYAQGET